MTQWSRAGFRGRSVHGFTEEGAVFCHLDGFGTGADQFYTMLFEDAGIVQVQRAVQRRLSAHRGQQGVGLLRFDDLFDDFRRDRFDIGRVGQFRSVMIVAGFEFTRMTR